MSLSQSLTVNGSFTESDGELEGLIPEASEVNIQLLSIEPEQPVLDEKQSLGTNVLAFLLLIYPLTFIFLKSPDRNRNFIPCV